LTYRSFTGKDGQERTVAEIKADDAQVVAPARQAAPTSDEHDEAPRVPSRRPTTGQRRDTDDIPF
jgi:single-stranded DNA-binding protein